MLAWQRTHRYPILECLGLNMALLPTAASWWNTPWQAVGDGSGGWSLSLMWQNSTEFLAPTSGLFQFLEEWDSESELCHCLSASQINNKVSGLRVCPSLPQTSRELSVNQSSTTPNLPPLGTHIHTDLTSSLRRTHKQHYNIGEFQDKSLISLRLWQA